jgi:hypothetical protein
MIDLFDWCTSGGRWSQLRTLPALIADDRPRSTPDPTRFVWHWTCQYCKRYYLGTDRTLQPCPRCGRVLTFVATWDLRTEQSPRWWYDPGARP